MEQYAGPIFGKFWVGLGFVTDFIQLHFLLFVFAWTLGFTILMVPKYQNFDVFYNVNTTQSWRVELEFQKLALEVRLESSFMLIYYTLPSGCLPID